MFLLSKLVLSARNSEMTELTSTVDDIDGSDEQIDRFDQIDVSKTLSSTIPTHNELNTLMRTHTLGQVHDNIGKLIF